MKRVLAGILLFMAIGWAQAPQTTVKPNFSGRWRMDKDKSDFGSFGKPDILVQVVDDHPPTLNVHTVETVHGKTTSADVLYYTDGRESSNTINGRDATSKAFWDGGTLIVRTNMKDSKNEDVVMLDEWNLSKDSQTLTRKSHIETPKGQVDMTLVCTKETLGG